MKFSVLMGAAALCLTASDANAVIIDTNPATVAVTLTPPFGSLTQAVGTATIATGIDFSFGNVEGIFNDPPLGFCGINTNGVCDLLTDVDGRIVVLNTLNQGLTNFLFAEAGTAASNALTLTAFGINNNILASAGLTNPVGPNGRFTATITRPTADIAFFRISGADSYGVNLIRIDTPTASAAIPEPASWAMLIAGFGLTGAVMRRRRSAHAAA